MKKSILTLSLSLMALCSMAQMPIMDIADEDCGVNSAHKGAGLPRAFTGKGIVVGIVDSGIDYTHPAFRNADGTLRIAKVWEQGTKNLTFGQVPTAGYGMEFTSTADILRSATDSEAGSHGTHVLGIAAGNKSLLSNAKVRLPEGVTAIPEGVAPDAELVVVAIPSSGDLGPNNECVMDAIRYIYAYADEVGKPCVVNLSLGSHAGPHDGTSLFDVFADSIQGEGRLIVGAAGNFGSYKNHLRTDFNSADDAPAMTFVDFYPTNSYKYKTSAGEIDIWGDGDFEVSMVAYNIGTHTAKAETLIYPVADADNYKVTNITGTVSVHSEVSPLNGKHHIALKSAITGTRTNYALALKITPKGKAAVDMWSNCSKFEFASKGEDGFTEPADESTVMEIGSTAKRIISVGAYVTRSSCVLESGKKVEYAETVGDLFSFSGRGATGDGRMKPDICAPGGIIVSSISSMDASGSQQPAFSFDYNGNTYQYGYLYGTSMSSPFVAGTMALWLEANPKLTPEQAMELLKQTSTDPYPSLRPEDKQLYGWGNGKINVWNGLKAICESTGIGNITIAGQGIGENARENAASAIYTLSGQRIAKPLSGTIYIANGKKIIR